MSSNHVEITLQNSIKKTPRVMQCAGMFDMPVDEKLERHWSHTLPLDEHTWQVGLIVGASGAGKSLLAEKLWPGQVKERWEWDNSKSLLDNFPPEISTREITSMFNAVGLGSVPAWVRPYSTLSNGERFRADMARTLLEVPHEKTAVVDEFTSVVDRQVAKVASHCVQKAIRRDKTRKFVAVTCHYDVEDWLQPEWVYDVSTQEFRWRSVQPRPRLQLKICKAQRSAWGMFAHHHYLNKNLSTSARCFVAYIDETPVAFTSYIHFMHPRTKNIKMGHRLVVLPDWQGLGIATYLGEWLGQYLWERGYRYRSTTAHPAMIHIRSKSPRWKDTTVNSGGKLRTTTAKSQNIKANISSRKLTTRNFEYVAPKKRHGKPPSVANRSTTKGTYPQWPQNSAERTHGDRKRA